MILHTEPSCSLPPCREHLKARSGALNYDVGLSGGVVWPVGGCPPVKVGSAVMDYEDVLLAYVILELICYSLTWEYVSRLCHSYTWCWDNKFDAAGGMFTTGGTYVYPGIQGACAGIASCTWPLCRNNAASGRHKVNNPRCRGTYYASTSACSLGQSICSNRHHTAALEP